MLSRTMKASSYNNNAPLTSRRTYKMVIHPVYVNVYLLNITERTLKDQYNKSKHQLTDPKKGNRKANNNDNL
jgi:hypothetical protein